VNKQTENGGIGKVMILMKYQSLVFNLSMSETPHWNQAAGTMEM